MNRSLRHSRVRARAAVSSLPRRSHRAVAVAFVSAVLVVCGATVAAGSGPTDAVEAMASTAGLRQAPETGSTEWPEAMRLGGDTRYETSAAVVSWRADGEVPAGPKLRLVSGATPLLAVALGADAVPTLFVPPTGQVPAAVRAAYQKVNPQTVEVAGGLADVQVRAVVGNRAVKRLPGTDPIAVSWRRALDAAVQGSDDQISQMPPTFFTPARVLAEAAAAVQVRGEYVVITPERGRLPPHNTDPGFHYPDPGFLHVTVVGGTSTIPTGRRAELLRGQHELEHATYTDLAGAIVMRPLRCSHGAATPTGHAPRTWPAASEEWTPRRRSR